MKKIILILVTTLFLFGCGGVTPKGEYRVGGSYSYFSSNGSVSFYNKTSSGRQNCKTVGSWKIKDEKIYVSGLYNSNCPGMSRYNGKYLIEGSRLVGPR